MPNKTNKFTILIDDPTNEQLIALAHKQSMSKGAFIRALINRCATMTFSLQPTCADGQRCSCPQMHAFTPQAAALAPAAVPPGPDAVPRAPFPFPPTLPVRDPEGPPNDPEPYGQIPSPRPTA